MTISLHDLCVNQYLRTLGSVSGFLDKSLKHFQANGVDPDSIVGARLAPDMLPLSFQINSVAHHSAGAIEAARTGVFGPPSQPLPETFAALQETVEAARAALKALTPDEMNALTGRDVVFKLASMEIPFTTEGFILSFSVPNFYFHAATAYDLLRANGVPLGKRDFLGQMQIKA